MKIVKTKGLDIIAPKGSAFAYTTEPALPKAHMVSIAVGKRGAGKSVCVSNLIQKLKFDRVLAISPTFKSNSQLMKTLNIAEDDIYDDPDDLTIVDKIIEKVNQERDDLQKYLQEQREFLKLIKDLKSGSSVRDDSLVKFWNGEDFSPPTHKYGGRNPFIALMIDDCQNSRLFTHKKISNLTIKHRHIGAFDDDRPSIGISLFFLCQSYRCVGGGLPKPIRGQATNLIIFKNKDEKELDYIASEVAGEISKDDFMKAYDFAINDGEYGFLFLDLHRKKEHPSGLRSRFNRFIVLDEKT